MTALIVFLAGTDRPALMIALKPMSQRAAQESPLKVTDTPPSKFLSLSAAISNEPECQLPTGPEETEMSSRVSVRSATNCSNAPTTSPERRRIPQSRPARNDSTGELAKLAHGPWLAAESPSSSRTDRMLKSESAATLALVAVRSPSTLGSADKSRAVHRFKDWRMPPSAAKASLGMLTTEVTVL